MFAIIKGEPPQPSTVDAAIAAPLGRDPPKALAKNRDERYATAKEFAEAVRVRASGPQLRASAHLGTRAGAAGGRPPRTQRPPPKTRIGPLLCTGAARGLGLHPGVHPPTDHQCLEGAGVAGGGVARFRKLTESELTGSVNWISVHRFADGFERIQVLAYFD